MENSPRVTVVIPTWNTRRWLKGCLDGLRAQTFQDFQVVMVDNGSTDGSVAFVRENYPDVQVLAFAENRGFAAAVNAGIRASRSEYVALLNVDTEPQPDWLSSLVQVMDSSPPEVGALASKMLSLENPALVDDAGDSFSWYGSAWKRGLREPAEAYDSPAEVLSACGGAALYRRTFLEETGGFDEHFISYLEDVDLGLRGQLLGYRCFYVPSSRVLHQGKGAGIPRPWYVTLVTRNRLAILVKCIPARLWLRHLPTLLYGQFYFFLVYKKPLASLKGYAAFIRHLPVIWKQRRQIQRTRRVPDERLEAIMSNELGEPGLGQIFRTWLSRWRYRG